MTISTENYEAMWGFKPKPSTRGLWMFLILGREGEATMFQMNDAYRQACKAVKAEAKLIGRASGIRLCP